MSYPNPDWLRHANPLPRQSLCSSRRGRDSTISLVSLGKPTSLLDVVASSAPVAILQMFFAVLVVYFFLSGWTRMRRQTITSRGSFTSALTTARVIQEMVDATSAYLSTITIINISLGLLVAGAFWLIGLPDPLMWGGIVALSNYMPYLGPIMASLLNNDPPKAGVFYGLIRGRVLHGFDVIYQPREAEPVEVGRVVTAGNTPRFRVWTSFAPRERARRW